MLRDISGIIQIVAVKKEVGEKIFELMSQSRESVLEIEGKTKLAKQAPGGVELVPERIEVLAVAQHPLPIDVSDFSKTELPKRLDYRFLDLHRRHAQAIFKIQATLMKAFREFMNNEGVMEAIFPTIISASSEGGTEIFPVQYFEKKAFLSQSCQLYKQMLACSMEKVFTVFTVERAEKHNTLRHLNESRQMDFEMAFADDKIVMDVMGRCVQHIVKKIIEDNKEELEILGLKLKVPAIKYMTFEETAELMKKEKVHCGEDDLTGEAEAKLGELYPDTIIFVHDWPLAGKTFYIMPSDK
jgi:aspartyl-tRNA synthetase